MPRHFDPRLINDPFGDPGLYVDLVFERRALLFDLGDLSPLAPRKLLRVSDVFVTHRHMDHFVGFDQLLRILLGREKTVGVFGPPGLIEAVGHKLSAYTWNLIAGYDGNLVFRVTEVGSEGTLTSASFSARAGFAAADAAMSVSTGGVLLQEPGFQVCATTIDHGIPTLAFALEERARINIWRNRLESLGLAVGPWLRGFKDAILRGAPDDAAVQVGWAVGRSGPGSLPLGELKQQVMQVTSGRKLAYVVDAAFTDANIAKIAALVQGADILFIEAAFLEADAEDAAARRHLTARQAGALARLADVKRLVTLHYSPRYQGQGERLAREAQAAFLHA